MVKKETSVDQILRLISALSPEERADLQRRVDKLPRKKAPAMKPARSKAGSRLSDLVREYALSFPETHEDQPWGHPAFKVKNKSFVFMGFTENGVSFSVKLTYSLLSALALPFVEPTGYGLGKSGWITAILDRDDEVPPAVVRQWIAESFANVAPKTLLKQLDQATVTAKKAKPAKRSAVKR
jgi:predicted DNA-binding protein (MmcQ/YjbR family)